MNSPQPPWNTGPMANLSKAEKEKRLDAWVRIWQSETEQRAEREGYRPFITDVGLDEYRYSAWLRFPEWERSAVVGQVIMLQRSASGVPEGPVVFSTWRRDSLLQAMPDWKVRLPGENVFNVGVRITPGGLGEGTKWAVIMPKPLIPRYKAGWPTQQDWVTWTRSFDWLAVAVGFIRAMLDNSV
jgi:hypothetical protein